MKCPVLTSKFEEFIVDFGVEGPPSVKCAGTDAVHDEVRSGHDELLVS